MTEQHIIEALANKVMGWKVDGIAYVMADNPDYLVGVQVANWNPLQNIADAWKVLKRLEAFGWEWEMKAASYLHPSIKLTHGVTLRKVFAHGDDEAKTICNAAMKVVA